MPLCLEKSSPSAITIALLVAGFGMHEEKKMMINLRNRHLIIHVLLTVAADVPPGKIEAR